MELLFVNSAIVAHLLLIYVTIVFLIAVIVRNNSIMDIFYGPAFFLSIGGAIIVTITFETLPVLIADCMALWAMRLSFRIYRKNRRQPEDARYAKWRRVWQQRGYLYFLARSYLQVFLLQGVVIFFVATPGIIALSFPEHLSPLFALLGALIFLTGLGYETVADWQLDRFLARKRTGTETAPLMTSGLFRFSRRPNYFGETLVWWGLAIMVLPLPYGWLGLISPILITFIVTKITGPMLEQIFTEKYPEAFKKYQQSTNYLSLIHI